MKRGGEERKKMVEE